jgi:protein TonB
MLEHSLFESQDQKKTRKPMTVIVSVIAHIVTVGALLLIPLLQTQALTVPPVDMSLLMPRVETPKPVEVFSARPAVQKYTEADPALLTAPDFIPPTIAYVDEPPKANFGFAPASSASGIAALISNLANQPTEAEAPPLPPPPLLPPPAVKAKPIRVSHLEKADLIHQVNPAYPPLAKQTRVQGVVVLEATISKEGGIESLRVVTGHPLLTGAALDAVKQWRYRPVLLNGEPIEVITTITVSFTLQ